MKIKLFLPLTIFLIISCGPSEEPSTSEESSTPKSSKESFTPKSIYDCNRTYYETAYETTWTSTEGASLNLNKRSGKITFTPPGTEENKSKIAWGMNADKFFEHCSVGNRGVWSTACSHFQHCISVVKNTENNKDGTEASDSLSYQETAVFIKQKLYSRSKTKARESCNRVWIADKNLYGNRCVMKVDNIIDACDVVSRTYSSVTVGDSIFKNIPELNYEQAQELGKKAVKGYGECMCALHNALDIKDDMSIGYCVDDSYYDCDTAFCGRNLSG